MSNLASRVLVAVVFVPLLLWIIIAGPAWGWWALVGVACLVGLYEFASITQRSRAGRALFICVGAAYFAVFLAGLSDILDMGLPKVSPLAVLFWIGLGPLVVLSLFHLFYTDDTEQSFKQASAGVTGAAYVGGLFACVAAVRNLGGNESGWGWVLILLGLNWLNDTGAYFTGRFAGRHKLFPRVSPKKTWEGAFGGLAAGFVWLLISKFLYLPEMTFADCVVLGLVGGALGQVGDLLESVIKRAYGVKDSGMILPGHGGILDRVDAVLLTAPLVVAYVILVHPL